jgi:hypothetical protein
MLLEPVKVKSTPTNFNLENLAQTAARRVRNACEAGRRISEREAATKAPPAIAAQDTAEE